MNQTTLLLSVFYLIISCNYTDQKKQKQTVANNAVNKTSSENQVNCNHPDAIGICMFMNMPTSLDHRINIPIYDEKQNLIIAGKVINAETKKPYSGIYMYAYHTDANGLYSKNGKEEGIQKVHGKYHGWCMTDEEGNYEIHSIKPGAYPSRNTPAHIHAWLKIDDDLIFYINDFVFADDPLVNSAYLANMKNKNNPKELDNGVVELSLSEGKYFGRRDIIIVE
jgi:protocatechuate 3,4-dioxygenase beta subunit